MVLTMKTSKKPANACPIVIIGRNTHPMVVFSKILESPKPLLLGDVRGNVPAHCHGHQFGHLLESFVDCCMFACCPGGRWGNTERVVTQCECPVASRVALDVLHWAMLFVLLRRIRRAFEMGCDGIAFVHHRQFCYWP
jgi:hypothetical protein